VGSRSIGVVVFSIYACSKLEALMCLLPSAFHLSMYHIVSYICFVSVSMSKLGELTTIDWIEFRVFITTWEGDKCEFDSVGASGVYSCMCWQVLGPLVVGVVCPYRIGGVFVVSWDVY